MKNSIRPLSEVVISQFVTGEVINQPASVVKELIENAIDAGATLVKVSVREGGKDLIQITDNGCGMSPSEARLAFVPHTTSKIISIDDINTLHTFGFRGEALASISAVAQVELRTRQADHEIGTLTEINGGEFSGQTAIMCSTGSRISVRNLFYNNPARRRFMEKSTTLDAQIKSEFQRIALCHPQVTFELSDYDTLVYRLEPASLAPRIVDVIGASIKPNLLKVTARTAIVRIEGYIGRPTFAKYSNNEQFLFVNGRYIKSPYLASAILKAYEKLLTESCQPSYFLYLTIAPKDIDINIHPQKTEVKFSDDEAVWRMINIAIAETLNNADTNLFT